MKIESKFNIGDFIFVVTYDNRIKKEKVAHLIIYSDGLVYKCGSGYSNTYYENSGDVFGTESEAKAEAIKRFAEELEQSNET